MSNIIRFPGSGNDQTIQGPARHQAAPEQTEALQRLDEECQSLADRLTNALGIEVLPMQARAIHTILTHINWYCVGITPTKTGADSLSSVMGNADALREFAPHVQGPMERAIDRYLDS